MRSYILDILTTWIDSNQNLIIEYVTKFITALVIFFVGKLLANIINKGTKKILTMKSVDSAVISFISSIVYGIVVAVAFIVAISHLGFNTTSLVAIIGAAGLAIGLALQGSLSNFASGILLISLKPFKSGDFVEVSGTAGIVESIHIFSTQLRTPDNKTVIVPNGSITNSSITNYSTKPTRRIDLIIGVSYDADLAKTKEILLTTTQNTTGILTNEEITVGVSELAESSVNLVVRPWVKTSDYWPVYFELLEKIKIALDEANIEIPYPQLSLHVNPKDQHES